MKKRLKEAKKEEPKVRSVRFRESNWQRLLGAKRKGKSLERFLMDLLDEKGL